MSWSIVSNAALRSSKTNNEMQLWSDARSKSFVTFNKCSFCAMAGPKTWLKSCCVNEFWLKNTSVMTYSQQESQRQGIGKLGEDFF